MYCTDVNQLLLYANMCCTVLYFIALYYTDGADGIQLLLYAKMCCTVLYCIALYYTDGTDGNQLLQYGNNVLHCNVLYCTVLYTDGRQKYLSTRKSPKKSTAENTLNRVGYFRC